MSKKKLKSKNKKEKIFKKMESKKKALNQKNKEIAKLKRLYDATQIHSKILPPRKKNGTELDKIK